MAASITFWMSSAGVPILAFVLNIAIRLIKALPISVGADWVLILLAFDFVVENNTADFVPYLVEPTYAGSIASWLIAIIFAGLIIWLYCIFWLEPAIDKLRTTKKLWDIKALAQVVVVLGFVCAYTYLHLNLFSIHRTL